MYKFSLDKSSRKFICPNCSKKTFVRYINNETNQYLENNVGRCDRETKCQYHFKPNGNQPLVNINGVEIAQTEPTFMEVDFVKQSIENNYPNNFITYLKKHFSNKEILRAIKKYYIGNGTHWNGATIFWQIDEDYNVHTGKIMLYDVYTGKRMKKPYPHINWIHKVYNINDFVLQQCLFGIHNLSDHSKYVPVCIVEAEKTAIIMSILCPEYLWLATGSKTNFKEKLLQPLKEYKVIVYPDKSEYVDWNKTAQTLNKKGYNLKCSHLLEKVGSKEGQDLVDLALIK